MKTKRWILIAIIILLFICGVLAVYAIYEPGKADREEPQYVSDEVLIGLKEGAILEEALKKAGLEATKTARIHTIKPAITRYRKAHPEALDLSDEEVFNEAYNEMPEAEKRLFRSYKIGLSKGVSVDEAISRLMQIPDVEYAEPNYIMRVQDTDLILQEQEKGLEKTEEAVER